LKIKTSKPANTLKI